MNWTDIFTLRIPHIYFVYGLAFFTLGMAVAMEVWRADPIRFRQVMWPLAVFGLVHGTHEWVEMFVIVGRQTYGFQATVPFEIFRLVLLAVSFVTLLLFGMQRWFEPRQLPYLVPVLLLLYSVGVLVVGWWLGWQKADWFPAADVLARYSLAIPGAIFGAWAFLSQRQKFLSLNQHAFANDLLWAAIALLLYGIIGQFFVGPSRLFPSNVINAYTFQSWFGIPVQLFRTCVAVITAIFTVRLLRAFEYYRRQSLVTAHRQVEQEITRREALREEFLHRVVETQEEERSRIARELHDELGQTLTGLAIGLRGTQISMDNPALHRQQLEQLEEMAVQALSNMRHLITELRPALLDDVGLPAALRHYTETFSALTGINTSLTIGNNHARLSSELETILFRITQEALTNIARHAQASQAQVDLHCTEQLATLKIKDDGVGFNAEKIRSDAHHPSWGLMGMEERVSLTQGSLQIQSEPEQGTEIIVEIPLSHQENDNGHHKTNAG